MKIVVAKLLSNQFNDYVRAFKNVKYFSSLPKPGAVFRIQIPLSLPLLMAHLKIISVIIMHNLL